MSVAHQFQQGGLSMTEKIVNAVQCANQNIFDKSNGRIIVNRYFSNATPISELIYQIISKKIQSNVA